MRDRYSSVQVMVLGIVVGTIGAIGAYALTIQNGTIRVHRLGIILLVVGIATFAVGVAAAIVGQFRKEPRPPAPPPSRYY